MNSLDVSSQYHFSSFIVFEGREKTTQKVRSNLSTSDYFFCLDLVDISSWFCHFWHSFSNQSKRKYFLNGFISVVWKEKCLSTLHRTRIKTRTFFRKISNSECFRSDRSFLWKQPETSLLNFSRFLGSKLLKIPWILVWPESREKKHYRYNF